MKVKILPVICGLLVLTSIQDASLAQPKYPAERIGIGVAGSVSVPWASGPALPGVGLSVEGRIFSLFGIETGIKGIWTWDTRHMTGGWQPNNFIEVPVMLKVYTRIVNASAGVTFGFSTDKNTASTYTGFTLKVSKDIRIYKGLVFEPALYTIPWMSTGGDYPLSVDEGFIGLELKFKYRFLK